MNLTKTQKILLGIVHFLPIIGLIAYLVYFFTFFLENIEKLESHTGKPPSMEFFSGFIGVFLVLIITILISIGVKIFDIIHLTKSNKNDKSNKVLIWVLLFIFVGMIPEIVYYFLEILPEKKQEITEQ
jgi:nitrogen fixation/metabolism regulation signal transduction histidine kinase